MREIGSEFWDVPITEQQNSIFPESTQWYISGRSALQAVIKELGESRSISLPSWCCDSMIKPFVDAHYTIRFYPFVIENGLVQQIDLNSEVLFLMDYFGYTATAPDLNEYRGIVIRDITHSLFSSTYSDADYYFGSLRKWCGIWSGGFVYTRDGHKLEPGKPDDGDYLTLRMQAMEQKREYINGQRKDKEYLKRFKKAEDYLETIGIAPAAERDVFLAQHLDVDLIKRSRRANAEVLHSAFSDWVLFPVLKPTDTPLFVPVLLPNGKRDMLRRHLIDHDIFCPIHWPVSKYHKLDERTEIIYANEISLVCDQRYSEEDINQMIETIREFMEE